MVSLKCKKNTFVITCRFARQFLFFDGKLVLRPISFNAFLRVHMQPEKVQFTIPQIGVDIKFEEIEFGLGHNQYVDLVLLLDSVDRLILQTKFLKYKSLVAGKKLPHARYPLFKVSYIFI